MKNSLINWTHHTFNLWIGCTKVSPECLNCFAEEQQALRFHRVMWGPGQPRVRTSENYWLQILIWNAQAARSGVRQRVFVASLSDFFDQEVSDAWRTEAFELFKRCSHLDILILTKRPHVALQWAPQIERLPNIWLGVSAGDQTRADQRLPILARINAAVRFVSAEPLLGPIDLSSHIHAIDWLISGGESGPHWRPMDIQWARSLRDQCQSASIAYWFKQYAAARPHGLGRLLDGREWSQLPTPRSRSASQS